MCGWFVSITQAHCRIMYTSYTHCTGVCWECVGGCWELGGWVFGGVWVGVGRCVGGCWPEESCVLDYMSYLDVMCAHPTLFAV